MLQDALSRLLHTRRIKIQEKPRIRAHPDNGYGLYREATYDSQVCGHQEHYHKTGVPLINYGTPEQVLLLTIDSPLRRAYCYRAFPLMSFRRLTHKGRDSTLG